MSPRLKICGITSVEDAVMVLSQEIQPDYLGLIFVPKTPRTIARKTAKAIAKEIQQRQSPVKLVGVFQNQKLDTIHNILENVPLHRVQLHGEESIEFCAKVSVRVIKVVHYDPSLGVLGVRRVDQAIRRYDPTRQENISDLLLDLPKSQPKPDLETQIQFLKTLYGGSLKGLPHFLAGGITPENVEQFLNECQPDGIDVASGVEKNTPKKDLRKIRQLYSKIIFYQEEKYF